MTNLLQLLPTQSVLLSFCVCTVFDLFFNIEMASYGLCNKKINAHSTLHGVLYYEWILQINSVMVNIVWQRDFGFRFPLNCEVRQKWNDFMVVNNLSLRNVNKRSVICSAHFLPESFVYRQKKKLLRNSVPTEITPNVEVKF